MNSPIKLADDTISPSELEALTRWITDGNRLTKGEVTQEFEAEFGSFNKSEHAVYVNSGSSANLLIAAALLQSGYLRNNKVVCPAVSWVTTVTPFQQLGYDVFLCDSNLTDLGIDLHSLEQILEKERPALLVLVHVLGHSNQMARIIELCERYDVLLVEDSCEALGSVHESLGLLGTLGIAGSFSFYYGHHISTIEGGMVLTSDKKLWEIMKSIRSHGWSRDLSDSTRRNLRNQHSIDEFRELYTFYYSGFNLRSTDLQAFIGLGQMKHLDGIIQKRVELLNRYQQGLAPEFFIQTSETSVVSAFAFGTLVENPKELAASLSMAGIESRPLICGNIGRQPFWTQEHGPSSHLRNADIVHDKGIYLPIHANMDYRDVDRVVEHVLSNGIPFHG